MILKEPERNTEAGTTRNVMVVIVRVHLRNPQPAVVRLCLVSFLLLCLLRSRKGVWGFLFLLSFFAMTTAFDSTLTCEQLRKLPYGDFLETEYWKQVASAVKSRDGHRCRVCNSKKRIAAHHRTYQHHGEEHLHLDDLTTLCDTCHHRHHFPQAPAAPPKVIVKTVVEFVQPSRPIEADVAGANWAFMPKNERRFFRKAAIKLRKSQKFLAMLGRDEVSRMIAGGSHQKPQKQAPRANGLVVVGDVATVEADMPPGEEIVLTRELLKKCRANGSFTSATVKAFGLNGAALAQGWAQELVGKTYARAVIYEAMRGRHLYSPATIKQRNKRGLPAL